MSATSHDVARSAGVTQPTVSRALRGGPGVSAATRERVLRAAEELGYVPQESGRTLRTRRTRRIGVVVPELTNPFFPELVQPLRSALDAEGYRTVLITDQDDSASLASSLSDGSLDGIIHTTSLQGSTVAARLLDRKLPIVLLNRELTLDTDRVVADNRRGAREVAALLASLGHERIASVAGPANTSTGRDRLLGFRQGLRSNGLTLDPALVQRVPFRFESGRDAVLSLLDGPAPPTAIFCGNDVVALGALEAARLCGVEVPGELTVIGFDDIPMAAWRSFDLTTVRTDLADLAGRAVRLLLNRIADPTRQAQRVVVPSQLMLRGTHAPPAG